LLLEMSYGTRIAIDARTHQRGFRRILLVNYIYFAASLIQDLSSQALTAEILEHLQGTLQKLETVWGKVEFERFRTANVPVSQIEALTLDRFTAELTEEETAALLVKTGDQLLQKNGKSSRRLWAGVPRTRSTVIPSFQSYQTSGWII